ncbi:HNH/endonuclease VII fold toxin-2 domain-containing protein [Roseobacter weihaiensis]|uniref:HNH/endonuclease VII fold toxin-2 domain-containing protein n=1 Tax=Roseobacter weihaiensis TaxID=2763262 RepID=UPI001D0BAD12|nr:HNH/endonuclease VII fold toxin-2 domain-containing protein [Roseobacter sp. H9]
MARRPPFDADNAIGFCETCPGRPPSNCRDERGAIESRCEVGRRESNRFFDGRQRFNNRRSRPGRRNRTVQARRMTWKDKHCGVALFQLGGPNVRDRIDDLTRQVDAYFEDIIEYAEELGANIAGDAVTRYGAAATGRYVGSAFCGPAVKVCAGAMTVVNAVHGVWSIFSTGITLAQATTQINDTINRLSAIRGNAEVILRAAQNPGELPEIQRELSEQMSALAQADPCLNARRCYMVPYTSQGRQGPGAELDMGSAALSPGGSPGLFDAGMLDLSDSRGCCPGQTGHHLLPRAMVAHCPGYNHGAAPTVCVEGATQRMGSHGRVHDATDELLKENHGDGQPMTMSSAINLVTDAYADSEVGDHCDPDCIKQQLQDYYNDLGCTPMPRDSNGNLVGPSEETDDENDLD